MVILLSGIGIGSDHEFDDLDFDAFVIAVSFD